MAQIIRSEPLMRRAFTALVSVTACASAAPALAADCAAEVQSAFEKQRTLPAYRVLSKQPSPTGEVTTQTDFQRPDRMYNKIVVPGEPGALETYAIGRWAWASHGFGFQELQPQFAQSITADVNTALNTPAKASEPFTCLGKQTRDGREFTVYQTTPQASPGKPAGPDNPALARTVFVDPVTGLPVLTIIGEVKPEAAALVTAAYTYPTDINIEAPPATPAGRTR
jgi:hypothetical protein